ncbi:MAG: MBOAT family protein [Reyranella sp.]|uniref:MBOAT family O-acyltransferase n=1 Tax=Reyranella sp. TaxID=1929291 RepID=UPI001AC42132|nr:MBOAT family protein [Reyranella sp.]MBN9086457.1 MBOAT family protein [Reyranella sp.]
MVFPTLNFLIFYLGIWPLSWLLVRARRHGLHKLAIIAASYIFYAAWSTKFTLLLLASVCLNWGTGRLIGASGDKRQRRLVVGVGVALNLALLGYFKYWNFFIENFDELLRSAGLQAEMPYWEIVLPVGISFFTFQGISYIVDLYRGDLDRPRRFVDVMLFISFFPHLVAGPIVRAASFLPQLEKPPNPNRVFVSLGVCLVGWGVFKKAVVANWLSVDLVDPVFRTPLEYGGADILMAVYGYAIQIYCDFSAYSDIAIGVAALLGYRFQRNFHQPYRAPSLQDFWRRWHMSLSSWLRDYLYIPLGGSKKGRVRTYVNLLLTMVIGGLWHGAAWHYVVWGALHGGGLAVERATGLDRASPWPWRQVLRIVLVFHFVCFCWIFFRAKDMTAATDILGQLTDWSAAPQLVTPFLIGLVVLGFMMQATPQDLLQRLDRLYHALSPWTVGVLGGLLLLLIEAFGGDGSAPFIYFQF